MYSFATSGASLLCQSAASGLISGISVYWFGEQASALAGRPLADIGSGNSNAAITPVKFNSRSPAPTGKYDAVNTTATTLIALGLGSFSHFFYRCQPRYPWTVHGITTNNWEFYQVGGADDVSTTLQDDQKTIVRRAIRRRITKRGYWPMFGISTIHNHQKTGGGAFQIHGPHFDNDITWVDSSAWRLGYSQSEVLDIPLLLSSRRRLNVT